MSDQSLFVAVAPTRSSASISAGATSMTVAAVQDRLGNALTMADFGSKGYGVISPGKDKEEQFVFTGISGATVSGISWVTMKSPYTETSGFNEAHAAGETVILYTNSPAFYNSFLNKNNDETIAGTYTFTSTAIPVYDTHPTFSSNTQLIDKKYADDLAIAGAPDSSTTVKGIVEEATQAEIAAGTAAGATAARLFTNPSTLAAHIQSNAWLHGITAGTADAITVTLTPTVTALTHNMMIVVHNTTANNAGCTLNVDGLGAKAIYKYAGGSAVAVEANDMQAAYHHILLYDSDATVWLLVNPVNGTLTSAMQTEIQNVFAATDITGAELETLSASSTSNADTLHTHNPNTQNEALFSGGSAHIPMTLRDENMVHSGNSLGSNRLWKLPASITFVSGTNASAWLASRTDGTDPVSAQVGEDGVFYSTGTSSVNLSSSWTAIFSFRFGTVPSSTDTFFIGFAEDADTLDAGGTSPTTSRHCGYQYNGTNWRITNGNGTTQTTTNVSTPSTGWHSLKIVRVASTSIAFYLDGTLLGTHTTNLPTSGPLLFYVTHANNAASSKTMEFSRFVDLYVATT